MTWTTEGFRLSPEQEHLWELRRRGSDAVAQCAIRLDGFLDRPRLEDAAHAIVARHEILRTAFRTAPGLALPLQVVNAATDASWQESTAEPASVERLIGQTFDEEAAAFDGRCRLRLLTLDPTRAILFVTTSSLCADARAFDIVLHDLARIYGGDTTLGEPLQYAQVAEWRHGLAQEHGAEEGKRYWRQVLSHPAWSRLGTGGRPSGAGLGSSRSDRVRDGRLVARLKELAGDDPRARREGLAAAWMAVQARWTGRSEVIVSWYSEGRDYEELGDVVGPCAGMLPVVSEIDPTQPLGALQSRLGADLRQAESWHALFDPTELPRHADPLPSGLVIAARPDPVAAAGVLFTLEDQRFATDHAEVELGCALGSSSSDIVVRIARDEAGSVSPGALIEALHALLEGVVANPQCPVAALPLVSDGAREEIVARARGRAIEAPIPLLGRRIEAIARETPDRAALIVGDRQVSYGAMNAAANSLARHLRARGARPEHRVAILVDRLDDALLCMLATWKAGAAYVPIDPDDPSARIATALATTSATLVVTTRGLSDRVPHQSTSAVVLLDDADVRSEIDACRRSNLGVVVDPEHLAYVLFTSGSTGTPKAVAVPHRAVANYADAIATSAGRFGDALTFVLASTLTADLGNTSIFGAWATGGRLVAMPADVIRDADAFADTMRRAAPDVLKITPSHLKGLFAAGVPAAVLPRRALYLGGEPLRADVVETVRAHGRCRVINHYGPTETTVGSLMCEDIEGLEGSVSRGIPVGRPISQTTAIVLDSGFNPMPPGFEGELFISGEGVARGYLGDPAQTAERFLPNPFDRSTRMYRTGDRASTRVDGHVQLGGRKDRQVKVRGHRIELEEVESVVGRCPGVVQAVVEVRAGAQGEPQLVAYVVGPGAAAVDGRQVREWLRGQVPEAWLPVVMPLARLPLTANGKVDRAALARVAVVSSGSRGPQTPAEHTLAEIWAAVLRRDSVGVDEDFFELGGDSILSLQIVARAARRGVRITARQLFETPTIAGLAAQSAAARPRTLAARPGPAPLTPIQAWFFERRLPEADHWNWSGLWRVGAGGPAVATAVLTAVLTRHDALRLRFTERDGRWRQEVPPAGPVTVACHDLRGAGDGWAAALTAEAQQVQRAVRLAGPICRGVLFQTPEGVGDRLLLVAHHLVLDAVSWRVLGDEVAAAWAQAGAGRVIDLGEPPTAFTAWARTLASRTAAGAFDGALPYWTQATGAASASLPVDHPDGVNTVASARTVRVQVEAATTRWLVQDGPAVWGAPVSDLLLAAVSWVLGEWSGGGPVAVDLEGHGREPGTTELDLSRTVGWFTTLYPLRLAPSPDLATTVRQVHAAAQAVPDRGLSYGALRYLSPDPAVRARLGAGPRPAVSFNYLGHFDARPDTPGDVTWASEARGDESSSSGERAWVHKINGSIADDVLTIVWTYSSALHEHGTIERLVNDVVATLRAMTPAGSNAAANAPISRGAAR